MKIIFSIISILAAGYLAMQTQFVQNIGMDISDHVTSIMLSNEKGQTNDQALVNEPLRSNNESAIQLAALQANNALLTDKVNLLEQRIERLLSNKIDIHEQASIVTQVKKETLAVDQQAAVFAKFKQANNVIEPTQSTQTVLSKATSIGSIVRSEQDKRVQQQAILRELSQGLELKALSSLTQ